MRRLLAFTLLIPLIGAVIAGQGTDRLSKANFLVDVVSDGSMVALLDVDGPLGYRLICLQGKQPGSPPVIGWATADYAQLIIGMLFSIAGQDLSKVYFPVCQGLDVHPIDPTPPVPLPPANTLLSTDDAPLVFNKIEDQSIGFHVIGAEEGKPLYVFSNPNCRHCRDFWELVTSLDGDALSGISVVKVPIGIDEASLNKASANLAKALDVTAVQANAAVMSNSRLFLEIAQKNGQVMTPFLVWQDKEGETQEFYGNPGERLQTILEVLRAK